MKFIDVFKGWGKFELGVEIDADAFFVLKGTNSLCIVRADAATEEKRCIAVVSFEHRPVELLAIATNTLTFRIEEEIIHNPFVGFGRF